MERRDLSLRELGWAFVRHGGLVWGGAAGVGPSLEAELVERRQALRRDDYWLSFGLSQMMPSIILANLAISLGGKLRGPLGSAVALAGLIVPSFAAAMAITLLYLANQELAPVQAGLRALLPATLGIVAAGAYRLARFHLRQPVNLALVLTAAGGLVAGISPLWLILGAGLVGAVVLRPRPEAR